jgi:hypothetical protein
MEINNNLIEISAKKKHSSKLKRLYIKLMDMKKLFILEY